MDILCSAWWSVLEFDFSRPCWRCLVARKSTSMLRRAWRGRRSYEILSSWWPLIQETLMCCLISVVLMMMIVMRSMSLGCFPYLCPRLVCLSTCCIVALLLTIHRNLHRWHFFHIFARVAIRSRADAYPQSTLHVEEDVSRGLSTGPEHWNRVSVFVAMTQPKVPSLLLSPPSEAMFMRCLDRKAVQIDSLVATCVRDARSLRWLFGSVFMTAGSSWGCWIVWTTVGSGCGLALSVWRVRGNFPVGDISEVWGCEVALPEATLGSAWCLLSWPEIADRDVRVLSAIQNV